MRVKVENGVIESVPNKKVLDRIKKILEQQKSDGDGPAKARFAATVMLVRDAVPGDTKYAITDEEFPEDFPNNQNVEVFMLRRVKTMSFVPDAVVFPGGRVDDRDAMEDLPWCGPSPAQWAEYMGCEERIARCVVVAAAREVFEESGVLLAGPNENELVSDLTDPSWAEDRAALVNHELSFAEMLIRRNLMLRTDLLGLISNFCTPEYEPKRFDTFFFAALMPEGQEADDKTSEAQIADWVTPSYAIRESDREHWLVVPPTVYNLTRVAEANSAAEFAGTRRRVKKVMATLEQTEDGTYVLRSRLE